MKCIVKEKMRLYLHDERGEFNVKGLAITIGAIIVIAAITTWLSGTDSPIFDWIQDVWKVVWAWIQTIFKMS